VGLETPINGGALPLGVVFGPPPPPPKEKKRH